MEKRIFATLDSNGILKVNCPHNDSYWIHDGRSSYKFCRQCHRVLNYVCPDQCCDQPDPVPDIVTGDNLPIVIMCDNCGATLFRENVGSSDDLPAWDDIEEVAF